MVKHIDKEENILVKRRGLTLTEILVVCFVLGIFSVGLFSLYRSNTNTFSATLWKQERAKQLEMFWAQLRKGLEEASDRIDLSGEMGSVSPKLNKRTSAPLRYRGNTKSVTTGEILSWNSTKLKLDFEPPFLHETKDISFEVQKKGTKLEMVEMPDRQSSRVLTTLNDVEDVEFKVSMVVLDDKGEERLSEVGGAEAVGTFIEIFITLAPPPNAFRGEAVKLTQSQKFRLNVLPSEI